MLTIAYVWRTKPSSHNAVCRRGSVWHEAQRLSIVWTDDAHAFLGIFEVFGVSCLLRVVQTGHMFELALYQPDIPQNAGTILRLAACMGVAVHIIEPAGFPVSDRAFRRAGMDYLDQVTIHRHIGFMDFERDRRIKGQRLLLASTKAASAYADFAYKVGDILMLGRESAGVPDDVHERADARLLIPMRAGLRSINVAASAAMILGEALRQLDAFPK